MTVPAEASLVPEIKERVIVALDVDSAEKARGIVADLAGEVGAFKVGLQLFTAAGPAFVEELTGAGYKIFLDLKFHDIPNTVAGACTAAAKLGVWMMNVHCSGGREMMKAGAEAAREASSKAGTIRPLVIGVTVLTSSSQDTLSEAGVAGTEIEQVARLAALSDASGLDGIVASAREASMIRQTIPDPNFVIVTPGIRAINATADDQKRVTTLRQALAAGSSYVVIGRPITRAPDRKAVLAGMLA